MSEKVEALKPKFQEESTLTLELLNQRIAELAEAVVGLAKNQLMLTKLITSETLEPVSIKDTLSNPNHLLRIAKVLSRVSLGFGEYGANCKLSMPERELIQAWCTFASTLYLNNQQEISEALDRLEQKVQEIEESEDKNDI